VGDMKIGGNNIKAPLKTMIENTSIYGFYKIRTLKLDENPFWYLDIDLAHTINIKASQDRLALLIKTPKDEKCCWN